MVERIFRFVLRHRVAVVVLCGLITLVSWGLASTMVIASSVGGLFLGEVPEYQQYLDRARDFGNDEAFVVGYQHPAPLGAEAVGWLEQAVEEIEASPDVAAVHSLLDAVEIRGDGGALVVQPWTELVADDPSALARILTDPRYAGLSIAPDGSAGALVVELTVDPLRAVETGPRQVRAALDALAEAGFDREGLHRAGMPAVVAEVMAESERNLSRLFPLSALALLLVVLLLFRRLAPALMAMGIGLISVSWTVGFNALLTKEFSIFAALVPAIVLTVAFSDIVHLWSAYLLELRAGKSKDEAIVAISGEVGAACLLTSATTGVGFLSLALVPTPVSRELGLVLGFGVGVALLLAVTLVPIALSWMKTPDVHTRGVDGLLDWIIEACARLSTDHAVAVLVAFGLLLVPLGVGAARFTLEADFAQRFADDNSLRVDQRWFEERFAGSSTIELFVDAPEPGGLMDTELFGRIADLQEAIGALPEVDAVASPVDAIRAIHAALTTGAGAMPTAARAIPQYLLLLDMADAEGSRTLLESWFDFERTSMRMQLRINVHGFLAMGHLGGRVAALARDRLGDDAEVTVTGLGFLLGWAFNDIVAGQQAALGLSFLVIALLMAVGLRSLKVGLISMVPNLLPLLALVAYAGFRWDQVDTDVLIAAIMAVGIGVDDTIHFLMRYRIESARAGVPEALRRTFGFAGRGIVMTTVILSVGFLPFALSDYFTVNLLGTALPGVLITALVADLLLVPAMIRVGLLRFR